MGSRYGRWYYARIFIILTGDPGIGKSTLLTASCSSSCTKIYRFLFFIRRIVRTSLHDEQNAYNAKTQNFFFLIKAILKPLFQHAEQEKPDLIIIDSIQNCYTHQQHKQFPVALDNYAKQHFISCVLPKKTHITVIVNRPYHQRRHHGRP